MKINFTVNSSQLFIPLCYVNSQIFSPIDTLMTGCLALFIFTECQLPMPLQSISMYLYLYELIISRFPSLNDKISHIVMTECITLDSNRND